MPAAPDGLQRSQIVQECTVACKCGRLSSVCWCIFPTWSTPHTPAPALSPMGPVRCLAPEGEAVRGVGTHVFCIPCQGDAICLHPVIGVHEPTSLWLHPPAHARPSPVIPILPRSTTKLVSRCPGFWYIFWLSGTSKGKANSVGNILEKSLITVLQGPHWNQENEAFLRKQCPCGGLSNTSEGVNAGHLTGTATL